MGCAELLEYVSVLKDGLMRTAQEVHIFGIVHVHLPNSMQGYASHLVELMECVMLTLDTVSVLLDSPVPPVMMVCETNHIL